VDARGLDEKFHAIHMFPGFPGYTLFREYHGEGKIILEILAVLLFCWLFFKTMKLAFRVAWGTTKMVASFLFVLAVPTLVLCLLFVGGIALLLPLAMVGIAFGLLKAMV